MEWAGWLFKRAKRRGPLTSTAPLLAHAVQLRLQPRSAIGSPYSSDFYCCKSMLLRQPIRAQLVFAFARYKGTWGLNSWKHHTIGQCNRPENTLHDASAASPVMNLHRQCCGQLSVLGLRKLGERGYINGGYTNTVEDPDTHSLFALRIRSASQGRQTSTTAGRVSQAPQVHRKWI
jgi:hypothetical protein